MQSTGKRQARWLALLPLLLITIILAGSAAGARQNPHMASMPGPQLVVREGPPAPGVRTPPPALFLLNAPQTANITVNYTGPWPQAAKDAFEFAAGIWETLISSNVTIRVDADWTNMGGGVLGGAGAVSIFRDFGGAPVPSTWYPVALANKLAGMDLDPAEPDIDSAFNSAINWYFGTNGNPGGGQFDFVSVALHELGHGLGFFGSMSVGGTFCNPGQGCWGYGTAFPAIYDRFAENGGGTPLLNFPNNSVQLASELTSNDVFFDGPDARSANGGAPAELYAPGTWTSGSSYSHLGQVFENTPNALMTFSIGAGESQHDPGPVALGMFEDMGWTVDPPPTATPSRTPTKTPVSPSATPTPLCKPTATPTATFTPTWTPSATLTPSSTPLSSPTPTSTPLPHSFLPSVQHNWSDPCSAPSPTPVPAGTVPNGGFESGPVLWNEYSQRGFDLILHRNDLGAPPHQGNWAAWLGGLHNEVAYIEQQVTVAASKPYLSFWHIIASEEPSCGPDFGRVLIGGDVVALYELCAGNETGGWTKQVINLKAYKGQTVNLRFRILTDGSDYSSWYLDTVGFQASGSLSEQPQPVLAPLDARP